MRILIVGDSLVLERLEEKNPFSNTYGGLLKSIYSQNKETEVIVIGKRNNDSKIQSSSDNIFYDIIQFEPDVLILHIGIVDCTPRIFSRGQKNLLLSFPNFIRRKIIKVSSKYRFQITKRRQKVYVSYNEFIKNYQKILKQINPETHIIMINIAKPPRHLLNRTYHYEDNVRKYNEVIGELSKKWKCSLLDLFRMVENDSKILNSDGIHLSLHGHRIVADEIKKIIEKLRI